ncbi:hypothetical protein [Streptomyces nigrescens]|uniref:hypothetical protein n=1 Tax=Streptomyces nigrescens TaxID=1920 RepID=UPI0036FE0916
MNGQTASSSTGASDAPIYAGLVEERGDVLAEVRRTAEKVRKEADQAIDFTSSHASAA